MGFIYKITNKINNKIILPPFYLVVNCFQHVTHESGITGRVEFAPLVNGFCKPHYFGVYNEHDFFILHGLTSLLIL